MSNTLNRRSFVALTGAALLSVTPAVALDTAGAQTLIANVVSDINKVINSGKSERQMFGDFERIFKKYGDVPIIARSTLGADARRATPAQLKAFSNAFGSYLARKYGKRFREFIGGKIEVKSARAVKSYFEVATTAKLQGQSPFSVVFRVSDKSGRDKFFDMLIEGISLGKTERTEIGAMLDRRKGDIDGLIADLGKAG